GLDIPVQAPFVGGDADATPQWLGLSCPSAIRRRGRRRYATVAWTVLSKRGLSAGTPTLQWLGHSCPSAIRRRGRRRYALHGQERRATGCIIPYCVV
ncbi:MAG: hypothetical protein P3X24_008975, partial [bacterium]|nr:hypothetical protein [bacterium]